MTMKTPKQMAREYAITRELFDPHRITFDSRLWLEQGFLAGYKAGFEIGCMKGSMAMQSTLDDDYHLTPLLDHEKLAKVMTKKETE